MTAFSFSSAFIGFAVFPRLAGVRGEGAKDGACAGRAASSPMLAARRSLPPRHAL